MDPELPRLSSAELVARFGHDDEVLRRYRMLAALIREGRRPGDVARTFGVSRESVRRLRQSFRMQGLDALQPRKRGGGHIARGTPLIALMQHELQLDPDIPAAVLWRRVQAQLDEQGILAPRSTFYRLLTQLRALNAPHANDQVSVDLLREALGALAEDPPLALGRSDLATVLLPDVGDTLQRGRWLQRAISAAVKRLRPSEAGPVLEDPRWRHYLIIAGEYEVGEKRAALQDALALSASTYSRAKRDALVRLAAMLPEILSELPPPEPPATLIAPPAAPAFTPYEAELDQYAALLRRDGLAVIWGATGIGKLVLAAALAQRLRARGQKVIWHTCRAAEDQHEPGMPLLSTLAAALALDGQYVLWNQLREPVPFDRRLDTLEHALAGRHWTVLIAHTHLLEHDEDAKHIMEVLLAARERQDIRLVCVSRTLPTWADPARWPALPPEDDLTARQAFLERLSGMAQPRPAVSSAVVARLIERINAVATALRGQALDGLPAKQRDALLAALLPIEQAAGTLRNAQRDIDERAPAG